MTLRLICRQTDCGDGANVSGAPAHVTYRTFDIDAPEVEAWLRRYGPGLISHQVVDAELLTAEEA